MSRVVTVSVASWEIECCAPPPVVGEPTSWQLSLQPCPDDPPWPGRARHDVRAHGGCGHVLVDGAVVARWPEPVFGPRPEAVWVWGQLHGTVHADADPDDLPALEGRVERVRVVRVEYRLAERGGRQVVAPVPGTRTLTDVRSAPRSFAWPAGGDGPGEEGVLVDVRLSAHDRGRADTLSSMSDEQWFWCFVHETVEPRDGCPAKDRLGPYPDRATAARALEIAHERTARLDKEDEDWEWGPDK